MANSGKLSATRPYFWKVSSFVKWITSQELAQVSGRSERTIRHYASQGRLEVKKVGKVWLINPLSAVKAGFDIPRSYLDSLTSFAQVKFESAGPQEAKYPITLKQTYSRNQETPASEKKNDAFDSSPETYAGEKKNFRNLGELGVYKDLLNLLKTSQSETTERIREYLRRSLHLIGMGYYEFSKDKKVDYYKQARVLLVNSIVEDDLEKSSPSLWRERVEGAIIPGVIGLIRRQERKK